MSSTFRCVFYNWIFVVNVFLWLFIGDFFLWLFIGDVFLWLFIGDGFLWLFIGDVFFLGELSEDGLNKLRKISSCKQGIHCIVISPLPVFTPEGTIGLPSVHPSVSQSGRQSVRLYFCQSVCPLKIWILW